MEMQKAGERLTETQKEKQTCRKKDRGRETGGWRERDRKRRSFKEKKTGEPAWVTEPQQKHVCSTNVTLCYI